ncbi:hypothetical protein BDW67DRAFT_1618 [Aspergillus spinulosporus]
MSKDSTAPRIDYHDLLFPRSAALPPLCARPGLFLRVLLLSLSFLSFLSFPFFLHRPR